MHRIEGRVRRLNALGFDVAELDITTDFAGSTVRIQPKVVDAGHHSLRLMRLTGLDVQENQARRLLNDITEFRAHLEREQGREVAESAGAYRWLNEVYQPTVDAVPEELRGKLEPPEVFHQILNHKWYMSATAGHDVGIDQAVASYLDTVLRFVPDERTILPPPMDEDELEHE